MSRKKRKRKKVRKYTVKKESFFTKFKTKFNKSKKLYVISIIIAIIVGLHQINFFNYVGKKWNDIFPKHFKEKEKSFNILILPFNRLQINKNDIVDIEEAINIELNKKSQYDNLNLQIIKDVREFEKIENDDLVKLGRELNADFVISGDLIKTENGLETIFKYAYLKNEFVLPTLLIEDKSFFDIYVNEGEKSILTVTSETEPIKMSSIAEIFKGNLKTNIESMIKLILFFKYYEENKFRAAYDLSISISFGNQLKKDAMYNFQINCLNKMNDNEGLVDVYTRVLNDSLSKYKKFETYVNRGVAYKKLNKLDEALLDYNHSLGQNRDYGLAYLDRGILLLQNQKLDSAKKDFNRAIDIDSLHGKAYYLRGIVNFNSNNNEMALVDVNNAIKYGYAISDVYTLLGLINLKMKNIEESRKNFDLASKLDPSNKNNFINKANLNMKEKKYREAINEYNQFLKLDSDNFEVINARGYAFLKLNNFDSAVIDFDKSIQLNSQYAYPFNNRALAMAMLGKFDEAFSDLEMSEKIDSNNPYLYKHKGLILKMVGKTNEAAKYLKKASDMSVEIKEELKQNN